ncbi:hypothetical protein [Vannielia litorea]|uniref:Uncharacterized protein n=1 Tax=Vannielia litorea TaxID=1217970 RepID=A0A1N6DX08_9RHOB|nr:hypothetical protein [Vannielia litorea]SIN75243.1 hypothetical protein SAMN05444002_0094 [Vannielia litorea]
MIGSQTAGARLTLRNRPAPRGWAIWLAVAGGGLVMAAALLRPAALAPLAGASGILFVLPLLWALRPGPVTVIDRAARRIEERSALGRLLSATPFDRIEGVTCDRVRLPARSPGGADLTIYRTLLLTGSEPVAIRGFGAPGPARDLKASIEAWLAASPLPA